MNPNKEAIEPLINEFLKNIDSLMEKNNITRSELARRLGTSKAYITKIFHGENLSLKTISKIVEALGHKIQFHFTESTSEEG